MERTRRRNRSPRQHIWSRRWRRPRRALRPHPLAPMSTVDLVAEELGIIADRRAAA